MKSRDDELEAVLSDAWELQEYLEAELDEVVDPEKFPYKNMERIVAFLEDLREDPERRPADRSDHDGTVG